MRTEFLRILMVMEQAFRRLEHQVAPPKWIQLHGDWHWRYEEKTIQQAIIQKLARQISGLHAMDVLLRCGLVQEQAVLQRTLTDIGEDIFFLALALMSGASPLHERYLRAFWEEEFDNADPMKSSQKREMIPRKSIRAYNARAGSIADTSAADTAGRAVHKTFSGYVHAASPQIMDMVGGGNPPRFHLHGMLGTPRIEENTAGAWNYFLRGLLSLAMAAKAFGDTALYEALNIALGDFEKTEPKRTR